MINSVPRYQLICESNRRALTEEPTSTGMWSFSLQSLVDGSRLEISSEEPGETGYRLDLLSVIRGLEFLDQASQVTLITSSRYVIHGLQQGIQEWKSNGWRWELYGKRAAVTNSDLWQRIDHAMQFHQVHWQLRRIDEVSTSQSVVPRPKLLNRRPTRARAQWRPSEGLACFLTRDTKSASA